VVQEGWGRDDTKAGRTSAGKRGENDRPRDRRNVRSRPEGKRWKNCSVRRGLKSIREKKRQRALPGTLSGTKKGTQDEWERRKDYSSLPATEKGKTIKGK